MSLFLLVLGSASLLLVLFRLNNNISPKSFSNDLPSSDMFVSPSIVNDLRLKAIETAKREGRKYYIFVSPSLPFLPQLAG